MSDLQGITSEINSITNSTAGAIKNVAAMSASINLSLQSVTAIANTMAIAFQTMALSVVTVMTTLSTTVTTITAASVAGLMGLTMVLPLVGAAFLNMATSLAGLLAYGAELAAMVVVLGVFALLGEGLLSAGIGLTGIAVGMAAMASNMPILIDGLNMLISSLSNIEINLVGILMLILLSASMLILAMSMQTINEQIVPLNASLTQMSSLISVGFVAGFAILLACMLGLSLVLGKVASGMDKVTTAMTKQISKLAVLNPLLATKAILTNPIVGVITVGLAVASALLVKSVVPAMATGGVVSAPTMALVGEGKYPEAVVPLGSSPQFSQMKNDIAAAVLQGISQYGIGANAGGTKSEIVINLDGRELARKQIDHLESEYRRRGYAAR